MNGRFSYKNGVVLSTSGSILLLSTFQVLRGLYNDYLTKSHSVCATRWVDTRYSNFERNQAGPTNGMALVYPRWNYTIKLRFSLHKKECQSVDLFSFDSLVGTSDVDYEERSMPHRHLQ